MRVSRRNIMPLQFVSVGSNCPADNMAGATARPPIADMNKDNRRGRKGPTRDERHCNIFVTLNATPSRRSVAAGDFKEPATGANTRPGTFSVSRNFAGESPKGSGSSYPTAPGALARVRVILSRSTRRHIAISPHGSLYAMPSLCGSAEATREWFRAFTAHSFLACRPLRPRGVRHRYPEIRCRHWPSPNDHRLGTPNTPAIRFARAVDFVASLVRFRYSLPGCSPTCTNT